MRDPGQAAIGTWSGGRFMRFGEAIEPDRLEALLRPDGISTLITADAYGQGEADRLLGRALAGAGRDSYCLVGAVGHDFYEGERQGAKGFPRFTDPRLRGHEEYAGYLRMAAERSLERVGVDRFDLLLLHNPDRTGYESEAVWDGIEALRDAGLTRMIGVAPGPANGFSLDLVRCFERFGGRVDWAMIILNPLEPWPGELCLDAAERAGVKVITRVVDHGGLFWDDLDERTELAPRDHRAFRPEGWISAGRAKLDRMRPIAARAGLTPIQLACQWNLAHPAVECVVPTLIQEHGPNARAIEDKRAELAALPSQPLLDDRDVAEIARIGDNRGSMALKGASPEHEGPEAPDRWPLSAELAEAGARYGIAPDRDLVRTA
ncbi:MAG TPA: aldo/keto reductase [Solirubrobacterales bacterium]|nr:aldo/keto reductase [Solirubrobacterales bacterium]